MFVSVISTCHFDEVRGEIFSNRQISPVVEMTEILIPESLNQKV